MHDLESVRCSAMMRLANRLAATTTVAEAPSRSDIDNNECPPRVTTNEETFEQVATRRSSFRRQGSYSIEPPSRNRQFVLACILGRVRFVPVCPREDIFRLRLPVASYDAFVLCVGDMFQGFRLNRLRSDSHHLVMNQKSSVQSGLVGPRFTRSAQA